MNKLIIILLTILSISCTKRDKIESVFITNNIEYWECIDYCYNSRTYFQFKDNGTIDAYLLYTKEGFRLFNNDGDLINDPGTWSIKNDSTFIWNKEVYKIEKLAKNEILLSYYHYEIKDKKCYIRLSKLIKTPKGPKRLDELNKIKK
ncbi:hypothetical protein ACEN2I_14440 [Flavobacterium sp. W22_SRS_FK3]|uniref:hypothetical protein n=1 Tax=Flavobacterium sp. W22_SRS_FK3 TaxID=3240275 RepID=UPI003F8FC708